jgi:hypothetical protein
MEKYGNTMGKYGNIWEDMEKYGKIYRKNQTNNDDS